MGSRIQCFMLEPTDRVRLRLRRFSVRYIENYCEKSGYCNANGPSLGEHPARWTADRCIGSYDDLAPSHADSRWPTTCEKCGKAFGENDAWQVFQDLIYRRLDTGAELILREAPPGAMYDAYWYPDKGPDGRALTVALPPIGGPKDDWWLIDGPSKTDSKPWTRTGEPPRVTASPSILTPRYHGWLRNGWLEEC